MLDRWRERATGADWTGGSIQLNFNRLFNWLFKRFLIVLAKLHWKVCWNSIELTPWSPEVIIARALIEFLAEGALWPSPERKESQLRWSLKLITRKDWRYYERGKSFPHSAFARCFTHSFSLNFNSPLNKRTNHHRHIFVYWCHFKWRDDVCLQLEYTSPSSFSSILPSTQFHTWLWPHLFLRCTHCWR